MQRNEPIRLDLRGCELQAIPPEVLEATHLVSLLLSENHLEELPQTISLLVNLEQLVLVGNKIKELPFEIHNLSKLESLNANNNLLSKIPETIGQLSNLKILQLSYNQIPKIPDSIGLLKQLVILEFGANELLSVPASIGELSHLQQLNLTCNQLKTIPEEIGKLKSLQRLNLRCNNLVKLPETITNLSQLKLLDVRFNSLEELPSDIGGLSNLQELDLYSNSLQTFPISLADLSKLQILYAKKNPLLPNCQEAFNCGLDVLKAFLKQKDPKESRKMDPNTLRHSVPPSHDSQPSRTAAASAPSPASGSRWNLRKSFIRRISSDEAFRKQKSHSMSKIEIPKEFVKGVSRPKSPSHQLIIGQRVRSTSSDPVMDPHAQSKESNNNNNNDSLQEESGAIQEADIQFTEKIGLGQSSKVYKGIYKGHTVAIKVLRVRRTSRSSADDTDPASKEFLEELQIFRTVKSPFVTHFYGVVMHPQLCFVMEYCELGSLHDVLKKQDLNWAQAISYAQQVVACVLCLHYWNPPLLHRDIKSLNFFVTADKKVKVGDFGLSRFLHKDNMSTLGRMRGTYYYLAPEIYYGKSFSTQSDVYSLSIVLWEIFNRCLKGKYQTPMYDQRFEAEIQILVAAAFRGIRPTIPPSCPPSVKQLITESWNSEPERRPSTKQLAEHLIWIEREYQKAPSMWDSLIERSD